MISPEAKKVSLYLMAVFYIGAGVNHFLNTPFYLQIMPAWLSLHSALVYISGGLEIALGLLLLYKPARRFAAWGIVALLVAVFPANIQMFQNYLQQHNTYLWVTIARLPLQLLLIWWAYSFTKR
jgi:uncharacterized membrane protein